MNEAPFHIGQKVVCVKTHSCGLVKRGRTYVIFGIRFSCCSWIVDVGIKTTSPYAKCRICCSIFPTNGIGEFYASLFAPVSESNISISASLIELAEEMIDVKEIIQPLKEKEPA
jgi:hypothetical protein